MLGGHQIFRVSAEFRGNPRKLKFLEKAEFRPAGDDQPCFRLHTDPVGESRPTVAVRRPVGAVISSAEATLFSAEKRGNPDFPRKNEICPNLRVDQNFSISHQLHQ